MDQTVVQYKVAMFCYMILIHILDKSHTIHTNTLPTSDLPLHGSISAAARGPFVMLPWPADSPAPLSVYPAHLFVKADADDAETKPL